MRLSSILLRLVFIGLLMYSCVSTKTVDRVKKAPEYVGVDPRVLRFVKEYKELAKVKGIYFQKEVTIGFKKINSETIVGETTYGSGWREIELDTNYWENSNDIEKYGLIFHELTHAYCGRLHTYGDNIDYKESNEEHKSLETGYYKEDGCPLSILFPYVLKNSCIKTHYKDYFSEMFDNCKPY